MPATIIDDLRSRRYLIESAEVGRILGVCKMTLSRWVRKGSIQAVRVGNENKFDPAAVIAYILAHET